MKKTDKKSILTYILALLNLSGSGLHFAFYFFILFSPDHSAEALLVVENLFIAAVLAALSVTLLVQPEQNLRGVLMTELIMWGAFTLLMVLFPESPTTLQMFQSIVPWRIPETLIMGLTGLAGTLVSVIIFLGNRRERKILTAVSE